MPLARHDIVAFVAMYGWEVSTHMPLARHDGAFIVVLCMLHVSTHMPLARHDGAGKQWLSAFLCFYSHASCEA